MKPLPNESYEQWASRVEMFERGRALQRIAQGESTDIVLEDMSRRIADKMLHPIFKAIRETAPAPFDAEQSRKAYEASMKYHAPVADHVDGNLFDKPE